MARRLAGSAAKLVLSGAVCSASATRLVSVASSAARSEPDRRAEEAGLGVGEGMGVGDLGAQQRSRGGRRAQRNRREGGVDDGEAGGVGGAGDHARSAAVARQSRECWRQAQRSTVHARLRG